MAGRLTLIAVLSWGLAWAGEPGVAELTAENTAPEAGLHWIGGQWRFHAGDHERGADPELDDSDWPLLSTGLPRNDKEAMDRWRGLGWFRLHLKVDEALWGKTLGFDMNQNGASEIYLNGELIQRFGRVGASREDERGRLVNQTHLLTLGHRTDQLLAVRYSNFLVHGNPDFLQNYEGFSMQVGDYSTLWRLRVQRQRGNMGMMINFAVVFGIVALLHLFLFVFSPQFPINAYFAALTASLGGYTYWAVAQYDSESLVAALRVQALDSWIGATIFILLMLFVYELFYNRRPRQFWILSAIILAWAAFDRFMPDWIEAAIGALFILEILRASVMALVKRKKGSAVVGGSLLGLLLLIALQFMTDFVWAQKLVRLMSVSPIFWGMLGLAIAMSIYLSREFAMTNRSLALQLNEVKRLGDELLERERREKDAEIERRVLEAENERKSRELEEARQFQLSLLPKELPHPEQVRFAAFMRTATEVGGDFYDFQEMEDGQVVVAVGDATGHGAKAGAMVASVKSLFTLLAGDREIPVFFKDVNRSIRRMNMPRMFMAMTLVKVSGRALRLSSAGMPPLYIYRAAQRTLEEIRLKALPLGGQPFPYSQMTVELASGDVALLMSDGLPELFNQDGAMFDYERVKKVFLETAEKSPEAIIAALDEAGLAWRRDHPQDDDITLVVIKAA